MQSGDLFGGTPVETYEWVGPAHASQSEKRGPGGELLARNVIINGDFENGNTGWSSSGANVFEATTSWNDRMWDGLGGHLLSSTANLGAQYHDIRQTLGPMVEGQWLGVSSYVAVSSTSRARIQVRFRSHSQSNQYQNSGWVDARFYAGTFIHHAFQAPFDAYDVMIQIQAQHTDLGSTSNRLFADKVIGCVADSEQSALDQTAVYFDGATPNVYINQNDLVRQHSSRVVVDGVSRPHASWDLEREIPGDLPPQVVGGSGIMQTTGTIVWADNRAVKQPGDNPWNPTSWWPDEGQKVEIYVSDGTNEWKQFTGVIDQTTGDVGDPVIQSRIIDRFDDLSVKVSHEAILRKMPPKDVGGAYRYADLTPAYFLDYAFRAAGWYCTPRQEPLSSVFAPLNGGAWAHNGVLVSAVDFSTSSTTPTNQRTPWGFGVGNARLMYEPAWPMTAADPVQITLMIAPNHDDQATVQVEYMTGRIVRLVVGADRSVTARTGTDESNAAACSLSALQMSGAGVVTLLVKGSAVSLRNDQGRTASGTGTAPSGDLRRVGLTAWPDASVGGLMVNHPDETYMEHRPAREWGAPTSASYERRAYIDTSNIGHLSVITAAPAITSRTAESVITEISRSLLAGAWIDEHGHMQWSTGVALRARPVVATVNTADHVTHLSVNKSLLGSRSLVTVTHKVASISESRQKMVGVWRGNTKTLTSEDHVEDIITPPADEEWVDVDTDYTRVGPYNATAYNRKRGSFMGLTYTRDGDYYSPGLVNDVTTFTRIGPAAWKLTHTIPSLPSDVQAQTRTPEVDENGTEYHSWNRNNSLPLVQAGAKVQWEDSEIIPTGVFGIGPELEHHSGYWVSGTTIPGRIASYLQGETQRPKALVTRLDVVADPRRQLGDVIHIDSPVLMGVQIRAMVKTIRSRFDQDGFTQSLSLITINSSTYWQTYEQFNAAGGRLTYAQWNALAPTTTYGEFNTTGTGDR